jgi:hypothetical protein
MIVSATRYTPASDQMARTGMLGWVSFLLDGQVRISGVGVRRTRSGRLALSFPCRDDGAGLRWTYVAPIDDRTRIELERQVLEQLGERA